MLFYSSRQTNQIRPFVFLENLWLANLLFEINWPLGTHKIWGSFGTRQVIRDTFWACWFSLGLFVYLPMSNDYSYWTSAYDVRCFCIHDIDVLKSQIWTYIIGVLNYRPEFLGHLFLNHAIICFCWQRANKYPRFVYFLPTFWNPKTFFQGPFSLKFWPYVWLVFKSGF